MKKSGLLSKTSRTTRAQTCFFEEFSLADLVPAYYSIRVSLLDKNQAAILSEQGPFYITPMPDLLRPWVLSLPKPPYDDPENVNILGNQFFNKQDTSKARTLLEEAYRKDPSSEQFALDFCRALALTKEYQLMKEIALPLVKRETKIRISAGAGEGPPGLG